MASDKEYEPIPCGRYSEYEVAILHHDRMRIRWLDDGGQDHLETLHPTDLQTRAGEEFMFATTDDGEQRVIRLDRIRMTETLTGRQAP